MLQAPHPSELQALELQYVACSASLKITQTMLTEKLVVAANVVAEHPFLRTFVAGGIAGAVSRTCTAPLDRIKMLAQEGRLQQWTMPHPTVQSAMKGPCDMQRMVIFARHVYFHDGALAFWKGNGVNCLKAGPEQAVAFAARQFYLSSVAVDPSRPSFGENFVVGAAAGCTAQTLLYPMEVVKTRMAVDNHGEYNGIADCIMQSFRRGGIRDLYRGMFANMAGILPHRGLEMGSFFSMDQAATQAYGGAPPLYVTMVCSFIASLFSQILTYPLNLARTRLQTQGVNGRPRLYNGLFHCLATIVRKDGPKGLFVGLLPNMLKAVPASMLMYITFRRVQLHLDEIAHRD